MFAMDYNIFILYAHLVVIVPIVTIVPFVFSSQVDGPKKILLMLGPRVFTKFSPLPTPKMFVQSLTYQKTLFAQCDLL